MMRESDLPHNRRGFLRSVTASLLVGATPWWGRAGDWPQFRGPNGAGVADEPRASDVVLSINVAENEMAHDGAETLLFGENHVRS